MRTSRRLGNMVAVMANEQQQFESLVTQLMSPENNIRNQAEVRKSLFFSLEFFHCFTCPRNQNEACCRENVFEIAGRIRQTLHAMCMLKFEVLLHVFKALHCPSLGQTFLFLVFVSGVMVSKESIVLMIFSPTFSLLSFENLPWA